jgi:hypothetical protein
MSISIIIYKSVKIRVIRKQKSTRIPFDRQILCFSCEIGAMVRHRGIFGGVSARGDAQVLGDRWLERSEFHHQQAGARLAVPVSCWRPDLHIHIIPFD